MPVDGYISQGIKSEDSHNGIDIASTFNSKVYATQDGLVIFSNYIEKHGNMIIIDHGEEYSTVYANLDEILVYENDYVSFGTVIGKVSKTGNKKQLLHFEIWQKSSIIDPQKIIQEYRENDV